MPNSDISRLDAEIKRLDQLRDADQRAVAAALAAAKAAVDAALVASEKAVNKAEESQLRVNQTQNEFRGQLKDQAATFARTEIMDTALANIRAEVSIEREARKEMAGSLNVWRFLAGFLGLGGISALVYALINQPH